MDSRQLEATIRFRYNLVSRKGREQYRLSFWLFRGMPTRMAVHQSRPNRVEATRTLLGAFPSVMMLRQIFKKTCPVLRREKPPPIGAINHSCALFIQFLSSPSSISSANFSSLATILAASSAWLDFTMLERTDCPTWMLLLEAFRRIEDRKDNCSVDDLLESRTMCSRKGWRDGMVGGDGGGGASESFASFLCCDCSCSGSGASFRYRAGGWRSGLCSKIAEYPNTTKSCRYIS